MFYGYVYKLSMDPEPVVRIFESEKDAMRSLILLMRTMGKDEQREFLDSVSLIDPAP